MHVNGCQFAKLITVNEITAHFVFLPTIFSSTNKLCTVQHSMLSNGKNIEQARQPYQAILTSKSGHIGLYGGNV